MKKTILLLMLILFFLTPVFLCSQTPIPNLGTSIKTKKDVAAVLRPNMRYIKNGGLKGIEFLDRNGNVKYRFFYASKALKDGYKHSLEVSDDREKHSKSVMRDEPQYFLINDCFEKFQGKEVRKDIWQKAEINNLYVLKPNGDLVFSMEKVPFCLNSISNNGKVLVCTEEIVLTDYSGGANDDAQLEIEPTKNLLVYSATGKLLYRHDDYDSNYGFSISPSGEWLSYCEKGPNGHLAVNLKTKAKYRLELGPAYDVTMRDDGSYTSGEGEPFHLGPSQVISSTSSN